MENGKMHLRIKNKDLAFVVYTALCLIILLSNHRYSIIVNLAISVLWIVFALLADPGIFIRVIYDKIMLYLLIYNINYFILRLLASDNISYIINALIYNNTVMFLPLYMYLYFYKKNNKIVLLFLVYFSVSLYFFISLNSLIFYFRNYFAARILASNPDAYGNILFIGGYSFSYSICILNSLLIEMYICNIEIGKRQRVNIVIVYVVFSATIIATLSTITVFIALFALVYIIIKKIIKNNRNKKWFYIFVICLFIAVLIVILNSSHLLDKMIEITDNSKEIFGIRINQILKKVDKNNLISNYNDLDERISRMRTSIKTFLEYPLTGVGYKYKFHHELALENGVGKHNEFIDIFAEKGLIVGIPYILIYIEIFRREKCNIGKSIQHSILITAFLLALFNSFESFYTNFILLFLIPTISYIVKEFITVNSNKY